MDDWGWKMSGLKVVFTFTILLSNLFAQESDKSKLTRETIQSQIDSLKEVRVSFGRKIERIDSLLKILEVKKAENEAEQFIIEGIILTTKKVFGTDLPKLRPSPDIDVAEIKVIPPGTKIRGFDYRDDGYWRVYYDGTIGFLLDSYIVSNEATEKFKEAAKLRRDTQKKELRQPSFKETSQLNSTNKTLQSNLTTKTPSIYSKKRPAQSKTRAEVLYLNFIWSDRTTHDKVALISGEVKNHTNKTVEVVVTVSARNSKKHIVASTQVYAPLVGNISPFGTSPFEAHFFNDGRDMQYFEASIAEVKVVRK